MTAAYQVNAYQNNAYQTAGGAFIPAFDGCAFQFNAFQAAPCPIPPTPDYDGHDAGRKKTLKKLRELEDKRIKLVRDQAENRKMMLRFALDPEAKAAHDAKMALKPSKDVANVGRDAKEREIAKIDMQMARLAKIQQNNVLNVQIQAELGRIHSERQLREAAIAKQIQEADDELALMMMM